MALTLSEARVRVDDERRACHRERAGFERFRKVVARFDTTGERQPNGAPLTAGAGPVTARARPSGQTSPLAVDTSLRRHYQQTVMAACPAAEESVTAHVAAELGPDVARIVCAGPLTPAARQTVLDRIGVALDARASFVALLDREDASLDAVKSACREVRRRLERVRSWESATATDGDAFDAARTAWERLDELGAMLDTAACDRQAALVRHRRSLVAVEDDVTDYLYGERPGLAAIASTGASLAAGRRAVTATVSRATAAER